jgi:hypothetical protein
MNFRGTKFPMTPLKRTYGSPLTFPLIEGVNAILHPINIKIKKWIDENIVF